MPGDLTEILKKSGHRGGSLGFGNVRSQECHWLNVQDVGAKMMAKQYLSEIVWMYFIRFHLATYPKTCGFSACLARFDPIPSG